MTPHAPEGGVNAARFTQADAATEPAHYLAEREAHLVRMSNAVSPSLANEARNSLCWFRADVLAARAEGATAERARLAGLASEEDRKMVQHYGYLATEAHRANCSGEACCEAPDRRDANKAEALALILARLAAARGEAIEEAARVCAPAMTWLKVLVRALDRGGESAWAAEAHAIYCELSNALTTPPGAGPKQTPPPEGAR